MANTNFKDRVPIISYQLWIIQVPYAHVDSSGELVHTNDQPFKYRPCIILNSPWPPEKQMDEFFNVDARMVIIPCSSRVYKYRNKQSCIAIEDPNDYEPLGFDSPTVLKLDSVVATSEVITYGYIWNDPRNHLVGQMSYETARLLANEINSRHVPGVRAKQPVRADFEDNESLNSTIIKDISLQESAKHVLTIDDIYKLVDDDDFPWPISNEPFSGPNFMLPDGRFIGAEDDGDSSHNDVPDYFINNKLISSEEATAIGPNGEDFYFIAKLGIIRCRSGEEEKYIQLNKGIQPTAAQYTSLTKFIEYNYITDDTYLQVFVPDHGRSMYNQFYDLKEVDANYVVKRIRRYYSSGELYDCYIPAVKTLLLEASRSQLLNKSKHADNYVASNQSKGRNRYERRTHSKIATTVADYNSIDMDTFWKKNILTFGVKVQGETDNYVVTVRFEHILNELAKGIKENKGKLEFKVIVRTLMRSFNEENVYVGCTCPDFKYTQQYWATQGKYNSIEPQNSNGKMIANPHNTKGGGCKHILLVLANLDWIMKIASVINNYIWFCKDNMENNYAEFIFPKLYGMPYDKAIQLSFNDYGESGELNTTLGTNQEIINMSNALGKKRTQYKKKPQQSVNPQFTRPKKQVPYKAEKGSIPFNFEDNKKELVPENSKENNR